MIRQKLSKSGKFHINNNRDGPATPTLCNTWTVLQLADIVNHTIASFHMCMVTGTAEVQKVSAGTRNQLLTLHGSKSIGKYLLVYTSVMIFPYGVSLSEQHTDLLICHCTKQDLSRTSRYVDKSSPEIARYRIRMPTARAATVSVHELSFTLKSWHELNFWCL